ncbi:MAG: hypothetical protein AAF693_10045 [Bacteroidota bacterium]
MGTPDKFDDQWRSAFEDAEMPPNPAIWDKVELAVANSANSKFKRRILFFKLMAAASIAFAFTIAGVGIYRELSVEGENKVVNKTDNALEKKANPGLDESNLNIADREVTSSPNEKENYQTHLESNDISESPDTNGKSRNTEGFDGKNGNINTIKKEVLATIDNGNTFGTANSKSVNDASDQKQAHGMVSSEFPAAAGNIPEKLDKLMTELESFSFNDPEIHMVPWYGAVARNTRVSDNRIWAGLGMFGGGFNPTGGGVSSESSVSPSSFSLNEDSFTSESTQSPLIGKEENGRTINIGMNLGVRIAPKWIIQSGIVLIDRNTTNTSNVAEVSGRSLRAVNDFNGISNAANLSVIDAYEIDNSYRFISVPIQAGYIILDKKLSLTLLGGVSNDLFIRKTVDGESVNFQEFNSSEGINRYNLTGLLGTEFGYHLGNHYLIALTPQIRQSISATTISGETVRPTFFEFGFRFKYLLK